MPKGRETEGAPQIIILDLSLAVQEEVKGTGEGAFSVLIAEAPPRNNAGRLPPGRECRTGRRWLEGVPWPIKNVPTLITAGIVSHHMPRRERPSGG